MFRANKIFTNSFFLLNISKRKNTKGEYEKSISGIIFQETELYIQVYNFHFAFKVIYY